MGSGRDGRPGSTIQGQSPAGVGGLGHEAPEKHILL